MKKIIIISLICAVASFFTSTAVALKSDQKQYQFKASKRKPLNVRIEIDAGEVIIQPGSDDREINLNFRFEERRYEIDVDFDEDDNELRAYFDVKKWFKDSDENEDLSGRLMVELPTEVPIVLYCKTKAGETDIELGGLYVKEFKLRTLAGETFVAFSEPNRDRMENLQIDVKIGELEIEKLGNANFEFAEIDGNIGEFTIDLTSDNMPNIDQDLEIGLNIGQTRIYIPEKQPIRFSVSKFLFFSELDIPRDFYKRGKYYFSENFEDAKSRMYLSISPGLGTLDIRTR